MNAHDADCSLTRAPDACSGRDLVCRVSLAGVSVCVCVYVCVEDCVCRQRLFTAAVHIFASPARSACPLRVVPAPEHDLALRLLAVDPCDTCVLLWVMLPDPCTLPCAWLCVVAGCSVPTFRKHCRPQRVCTCWQCTTATIAAPCAPHLLYDWRCLFGHPLSRRPVSDWHRYQRSRPILVLRTRHACSCLSSAPSTLALAHCWRACRFRTHVCHQSKSHAQILASAAAARYWVRVRICRGVDPGAARPWCGSTRAIQRPALVVIRSVPVWSFR